MAPHRLLITCYHHVGEPAPGAPHQRTWVSLAFLERHLRLLAGRGYRFCTVSEALECDGLRACITFDDGFADVADARPVLDAFGAPATFYVVSDEVGRRERPWDGGALTSFADASELKALAAHGWEIGSHADTHVRLRGQPYEQQLARLARSRDALTALLGRPPASLAFPYASYDAHTLTAARHLGFTTAVRLSGGVNDAGTDRFQLNRVSLCGTRAWERLELLKLWSTHLGLYPLRRKPPLPA